ncbi:ferritin-like domain-containing protein [Streptomyces sp. NBC_01294]|uniref:ferritin-like domain-containing protein n=1 Tax=Streptomyces sp. NBC_01294 TaxID=2903815 RepID=UPI003FA3AF6E
MLKLLLAAGGAGTLDGHWSDAVFVRVRRLLGLRVELLVLMIAEVVALGYYRALRDGAADPLTSEVAGRILADEGRHVLFHCLRLREGLAGLPPPARRAVTAGWRGLLGRRRPGRGGPRPGPADLGWAAAPSSCRPCAPPWMARAMSGGPVAVLAGVGASAGTGASAGAGSDSGV